MTGTSRDPVSHPPAPPTSSITKLLILGIVICVVISAIINLQHLYQEEEALYALKKDLQNFAVADKTMDKLVDSIVSDHNDEDNTFSQDNHSKAYRQSPLTNEESPETRLAHLSCAAYGGPEDEFAQEMVYWQNISSDERFVSPFTPPKGQPRKYMTFEPDGGGWNNIRMAMETVLGLAIAMGRTLVLPPEQRMYLLSKNRGKEKTDFSFADFFPMHDLARENDGLHMITTEEFLNEVAMTGQLRNKITGEVSFPPENRTDWNGQNLNLYKEWLRNVTHTPLWSPSGCMAAFPASGNAEDAQVLKVMQSRIHKEWLTMRNVILDPPPAVDTSPLDRMRENLADRKELCVYDEEMQGELVVHFMCYHKMRVRMLVHFYAFLYFEDWRQDLWTKRFMRDHVRYIDEIQCAAARIVHAMREYDKSRSKDFPGHTAIGTGEFDTFHIRRGDFQFKATRIDASEIYENVKDYITPHATIFIATDERDKSFFDDLKKHYDVKFLDDFVEQLEGVNTNYYGMIDQLVASRGRLFFGCWHSTFTGFIHRVRGYHSTNHREPGYENGVLPTSFYYVPKDKMKAMHSYNRLHGAFFNREFPTSWRDIDKSIGDLPN